MKKLFFAPVIFSAIIFSILLANCKRSTPAAAATPIPATPTVTAIITPSCSDGIQNRNETDVDCGGGTCGPCGILKHCAAGADCSSGTCRAGYCVGPLCGDGILNDSETDVDCGGSSCYKCSNGKLCVGGADCASGNCQGGYCAP